MTDNELIIQYKAGNVEALNLLIENFKPVLGRLAFRWKVTANKVGLDEDDLQQEGWIAFMKVVEEYDNGSITHTCSFTTYAYGAVEFAIRNVIRKNRPRGYKTTCKTDEVSICSIYKSVFEDENSDMLIDTIVSSTFPPTDACVDVDYQQCLHKDIISLLDVVFGGYLGVVNNSLIITNDYLIQRFEKQSYSKSILLLHYGLFGEPMSFTEIAEKSGLTVSYISNIEKMALIKIRKSVVGKQFMKLYGGSYYLRKLLKQREEINTLNNPERVVSKMDSIDNEIRKYLSV